MELCKTEVNVVFWSGAGKVASVCDCQHFLNLQLAYYTIGGYIRTGSIKHWYVG